MSNQSIEKATPSEPEVTTQRLTWTPPLDAYENEDGYLLFVDLPGVRKENLDLSLERNELTISALRPFNADTKQQTNDEILYQRTVKLPHPVQPDNHNAQFTNGVLRLEFHKSTDHKPRQITVKAE